MLGYLFAVIGFLGRARLRQVSAGEDAGPRSLPHREREGRGRPLLRPLHRPQGGRHPVPVRHRPLLLHRRAQRDADPGRAAAALAAGLRRRQLPHPGRPARHDDDGDHDLGRARPVRQLLRAADDRRPADGLPAGRGDHLLAADGGRDDPRSRRSSSAASRPAGPATRRSTSRPTTASTPTSSSSPWSASR